MYFMTVVLSLHDKSVIQCAQYESHADTYCKCVRCNSTLYCTFLLVRNVALYLFQSLKMQESKLYTVHDKQNWVIRAKSKKAVKKVEIQLQIGAELLTQVNTILGTVHDGE